MSPRRAIIIMLALMAASCGEASLGATSSEAPEAGTAAPTSSAVVASSATDPTSSTTTTSTTTTTSSTTTTSTTTTTTSTTTTTTIGRVPFETGYGGFVDADGVEIVLPAATVEMVGFHEAGHDGSKQMQVTADVVAFATMESRERGTGSRTAADIVVAPDTEIRSPVTGTVIRAGSYVLYCDHTDDFVVIEPDARPGWEVKMFHFSGLELAVGDRVEAGVTVVARRAAILPFESQVDELSAAPSWPHVHVEVIDPSIPDRPSAGGGC